MNTNQIITLAEVYCAYTDLQLSTVSTYAANDGKWLGRLGADKAGCTLRRAHRVIAWFSTNWPDDLAWPRDIPRPPKTKEAA